MDRVRIACDEPPRDDSNDGSRHGCHLSRQLASIPLVVTASSSSSVGIQLTPHHRRRFFFPRLAASATKQRKEEWEEEKGGDRELQGATAPPRLNASRANRANNSRRMAQRH